MGFQSLNRSAATSSYNSESSPLSACPTGGGDGVGADESQKPHAKSHAPGSWHSGQKRP